MSYQEAATGQTDSATASALRFARKVVVAVIGVSVLAIGIALILLPGPAVLVIPLGLAILGTEFLWARRLLRRVKQGMASVFRRRRDSSTTAWWTSARFFLSIFSHRRDRARPLTSVCENSPHQDRSFRDVESLAAAHSRIGRRVRDKPGTIANRISYVARIQLYANAQTYRRAEHCLYFTKGETRPRSGGSRRA